LGSRFYYRVFKNNLVYAAGMALLRLIELFLAPFSLRAKFSFGRLLGGLWYMFDFPDRELSRREMALALGRTHPAHIRQRALRLSMTNMIAYLCEAYFSSSLSREKLLMLVRNRDWAVPLKKALSKGKGAIVLTGHFSNEALLCYLVSAFGHASCVARYQRVFNRLMVAHRKNRNLDTLNEFETSYKLLLELLARNEIILATIDRPLKHVKGVCVQFLGHTIIAPYYPVDVARFSGAPIFLALLMRRSGRYDMHLEGPIHVPQDMDEREAREKHTQLIYSTLEKYISAHPHEWQWQNKRLSKKHWGVPRYPHSN
jgi:lauroyl/myristoyl acyltransferase